MKSDSLQDRIDALVREREDAEQSLEDVVLQVVTPILICSFLFHVLSFSECENYINVF